MNKIPYDQVNPLQNLSAWLVNADLVQDPAMAFIVAFSLVILGFITIIGTITSILEGISSRE